MHLAHTAWDLAELSSGRFALGLGTQIKAHVERRYGSTWTSPVGRMREWVEAIRSIGNTWQHGEPLDYIGKHTSHTLMTPAFEPGALPSGPPPIWLGALGPAMTQLATTVADGMLIHPFTSDSHLKNVTLPRIRDGLEAADRQRSDLTVVGQAIVACATDGAAQTDVDTAARWMIAFYGSTPAYAPVLETEGRQSLHPELRALSREGRWDEMAALVDDDLLDAVVLRGDPAQVATRLVARFGDNVDRVALSTPGGITDEALTALVTETRAQSN
jgi:probable F420-dependent oxidoreductase